MVGGTKIRPQRKLNYLDGEVNIRQLSYHRLMKISGKTVKKIKSKGGVSPKELIKALKEAQGKEIFPLMILKCPKCGNKQKDDKQFCKCGFNIYKHFYPPNVSVVIDEIVGRRVH